VVHDRVIKRLFECPLQGRRIHGAFLSH
jgi:hypothetical protein